MGALLLQFILSAAAIIVAGVVLTVHADRIAEFTGIGRVLAGSIFLAAATSLPELATDWSAVRNGMPDLAVGDLLGSSLFNLLILAVADLLHGGPGRMFTREAATHALSASMTVVITALATLFILVGPELARFTLFGIGIGPWLILFSYMLGIRLIFLDQRFNKRDVGEPSTKAVRKNLLRSIFAYIASAIVILLAAPYLASSAGKIAEFTGLGQSFIGTTLLAVSTSLPELVSTLAAVRMGAFDLALGNIFGSNAFNMVLYVPLDSIHPGSLFAAAARSHAITGLAVILATSIAAMGQLYSAERRRRLIEPDAFAVIAVIVGSLFLLFQLKIV